MEVRAGDMKAAVPNLPNAPKNYDSRYQDQLNRILVLFLQQAMSEGPLRGTSLTLTDMIATSPLHTGVNPTDTSFILNDASLFPMSGAGTIQLEKFTWSGKTGNTLTGIARGQFGTVAVHHNQGHVVVASVERGAVYADPQTAVLMAVL